MPFFWCQSFERSILRLIDRTANHEHYNEEADPTRNDVAYKFPGSDFSPGKLTANLKTGFLIQVNLLTLLRCQFQPFIPHQETVAIFRPSISVKVAVDRPHFGHLRPFFLLTSPLTM